VYQVSRDLHEPTHVARTRGTSQNLRCVRPHLFRRGIAPSLMKSPHVDMTPTKATSTGNISISCGCSNTAASHRNRIIFSSATTSTAASSRSKPYVFCWHTRSSIPRISSYSAATTRPRTSTGSTASTTNVRIASPFRFGNNRLGKTDTLWRLTCRVHPRFV